MNINLRRLTNNRMHQLNDPQVCIHNNMIDLTAIRSKIRGNEQEHSEILLDPQINVTRFKNNGYSL